MPDFYNTFKQAPSQNIERLLSFSTSIPVLQPNLATAFCGLIASLAAFWCTTCKQINKPESADTNVLEFWSIQMGLLWGEKKDELKNIALD